MRLVLHGKGLRPRLGCGGAGLHGVNAVTALYRAKSESPSWASCAKMVTLHVGELFKADPEFDPKDLPDAAAFLKEQGLSVVPL